MTMPWTPNTTVEPQLTPEPLYFGGKGNKAYPWKPLPYMEDYLYELENGEDPRSGEYLRPIRVGLGHFANFAGTEGIKHPNEIERTHLLRFQAYLTTLTGPAGKPLSLSYRQQLMKYLRAWINWLEQVRYIDSNPWYRVRVGRVAKQPKPLEDDEIVGLFDAHRRQAFTLPPFAFHRREVILTILFGWGLRIHELQSLNVSQMHTDAEWVRVRNKGGGTKTLPYSDAMKRVVQRWLGQRARHARATEDALVIDQSGGRLSIPRIREIVTECGARAGMQINPHRLRDTFGTKMLDGDVEVERVMKLMGHTNREQTLAYARVNNPKLKQSHDRVMDPLLDGLLGHRASHPDALKRAQRGEEE